VGGVLAAYHRPSVHSTLSPKDGAP